MHKTGNSENFKHGTTQFVKPFTSQTAAVPSDPAPPPCSLSPPRRAAHGAPAPRRPGAKPSGARRNGAAPTPPPRSPPCRERPSPSREPTAWPARGGERQRQGRAGPAPRTFLLGLRVGVAAEQLLHVGHGRRRRRAVTRSRSAPRPPRLGAGPAHAPSPRGKAAPGSRHLVPLAPPPAPASPHGAPRGPRPPPALLGAAVLPRCCLSTLRSQPSRPWQRSASGHTEKGQTATGCRLREL